MSLNPGLVVDNAMDTRTGNAKFSAKTVEGTTPFGIAATDFGCHRVRQLRANATSQVLGVSDDLNVIGIHAASIATQMVQNKSIGDRSELSFVLDSVGLLGSPTGVLDHTVALRGAALPIPASRLFVHEIFDGRETAMVADNKLLELTLDDTFAGLSTIGTRDRSSAATHAQPGWVWWGQVDGYAGAATHGIRATERPAAINTGFVTVGAHSRDLQVRSFGVTPTDVRASRGYFVA
jgi:hypothetical protein